MAKCPVSVTCEPYNKNIPAIWSVAFRQTREALALFVTISLLAGLKKKKKKWPFWFSWTRHSHDSSVVNCCKLIRVGTNGNGALVVTSSSVSYCYLPVSSLSSYINMPFSHMELLLTVYFYLILTILCKYLTLFGENPSRSAASEYSQSHQLCHVQSHRCSSFRCTVWTSAGCPLWINSCFNYAVPSQTG